MTPHEKLQAECTSLISKAIKLPNKEAVPIVLEKPPESIQADLAFPCHVLSKALKKDPVSIAKALEKKVKPGGLVKAVKAEGPYLNFFADWDRIGKDVIQSVLKDKARYGQSDIGKGKKVMVEYSSPNTNKPLHLGHMRNDALGMAVSNILEATGHKVIKAVLFSNRGIHICKSMLAYKKWGKAKPPGKKSDHFVGDFYVLYEQKRDEKLDNELYDMLRKWEKGDKPTIALWKKMDAWALKGFRETYKEFGSRFDAEFRESDFYDKARPIIEAGLKKGVFKKESDGAVSADLEKHGLGKKFVLRADGTTIYLTNDLALTDHKFKKYGLDRSVWVVASEQNLYFQQLFKIFQLLGLPWAERCVHMSYGMVYLPEGKMKSREGNVIDADNIISEMRSLASQEVLKREKVPKQEAEKRSKAIGIGALKYFLLKMDSKKDIHFDPQESLSFEGDTGPYVQYSYARASSILRKVKALPAFNASYLKNVEEKDLLRLLAEYPRVLQDSARDLRPHYLVNHIYKLALSFNNFYEKYPVLKAKKEFRDARICLVKAVQIVLQNGLGLLGIEAPERM